MTARSVRTLARWARLDRIPRLPPAAEDQRGTVGEFDGEPVRITVIGESTAAGVGVTSHRDGLAGCLSTAVSRLIERRVTWQVIARNGATVRHATRYLVPRLACGDPMAEPDVVVVVLGVNDLIRIRSARTWRRDTTILLDAIRDRAPAARILVAGIPPADRSPALPKVIGLFLAARARILNRNLATVARTAGVRHETINHLSERFSSEFFAEDGFHPSARGYLTWSRYLAAGVAELITQSATPVARATGSPITATTVESAGSHASAG